jgi:hypothetical protein
MINAYERVADLLDTAFGCLRWCLTVRGSLRWEEMPKNARLAKALGDVCRGLGAAVPIFSAVIGEIPAAAESARNVPGLEAQAGSLDDMIEPLGAVLRIASEGSAGPAELICVCLERHAKVQAAKRKGPWIERGEKLVLMPNFGLSLDSPPLPGDGYVHNFRVDGVYRFLSALGLR